MRTEEITECPDCGDQHMGRCGGLSFAARLRSVRLDSTVTETRSKRNYHDEEALTNLFGKDASERKEQYMEETQGRGALYRRDMADASSQELDWWTGSDREVDGDA